MYNPMEQRFENVLGQYHRIHPDAKIGKNVRIGLGTVIEDGCSIGDNSLIGHHTVLRPETHVGNNSIISHSCVCEGRAEIGNHVSIHAGCGLTMGIIIEDDVFIGGNMSSTNTKNIVFGRKHKWVWEPCRINRGARIGSGVVLLPRVVIGSNAYVGSGAVVTKDIPEKQVWVGNPARYLRDVPESEWL